MNIPPRSLLTLAVFFAIGLTPPCSLAQSPPPQPEPFAPPHPDPSTAPFPDFGFMLPANQVAGMKVFKLSQDYPQTQPEGELPPFFQTDFKTDWKKWLMQVRDYCFEGNTGNANVQDDFRVENNTKRKWFHMPWQHYGPNGREGFHGLTKEAPVKAGQLAAGQTYATGGAWAVGFFNDRASWKIGQVWKDHDNPDVTAMGEGFPNGSVLFKLLFVSIPREIAEQQVPFLRNGVWWDAYATYTFADDARSPIQVALIQMDIMVRDERALHGWVLGNFQFNGQIKGKAWEKLVPVGLMWGQDPHNKTNPPSPFPLNKTPINAQLKETIINPGPELPPTHLGWNGRLNGPLDNPMSSCFSCHSTAQYPQASALSPLFDPSIKAQPGDATWMLWFRNIKCGTPFNDSKGKPTDFCLQLSESLQNFDMWKYSMEGISAESYAPQGQKLLKAAPLKVHPVGRRNQ
jgi:hypothetical protein